jgi:hypothetical protein
MGAAGVELLRVLNRRPLAAEPKAQAVELIERLDRLLGSEPLGLGSATEQRIRELAASGEQELRERFQITFD